MAEVDELLSVVESTESLAEAEGALDRLSTQELPAGLSLGDWYESLAESAVEGGDFSMAIRAQGRALELGCEDMELGEEMLAWYLLKSGQREAGEGAFAKLRAERDGDPQIVSTLANARMDSGDGEGALGAYDEALELAKQLSDGEWIDQLLSERRDCRDELGLAPDDYDRMAEEARRRRREYFETHETLSEIDPDTLEAANWSLAWFPRDQIEEALARWPSLAEDLSDPDAYCRKIDMRLRELQAATGSRPSVAPLDVERLIQFAGELGVDPDSGTARSRMGAELGRLGDALPWPPGRNEACWCGSGRKYKHCCGGRGSEAARTGEGAQS